MNIFSSIPPKHANGMDYIKMCVATWKKHGIVFSVNHPKEIAILEKDFPDVKFIPTYQTQQGLVGKPLVLIDTILAEMRKWHEGESMFINADCHLTLDVEAIKNHFQQGRFTYLHRWNYDEGKEPQYYLNGVDAFLFTDISVLDHIQATHFCIGQTFFDIWFPYAITMAGMECCTSRKQIVFHKNHAEQYNHEDWVRFGDYTALIMGKKMHKPADVSKFIYNFIRSTTVQI